MTIRSELPILNTHNKCKSVVMSSRRKSPLGDRLYFSYTHSTLYSRISPTPGTGMFFCCLAPCHKLGIVIIAHPVRTPTTAPLSHIHPACWIQLNCTSLFFLVCGRRGKCQKRQRGYRYIPPVLSYNKRTPLGASFAAHTKSPLQTSPKFNTKYRRYS